MAESFEKSNFSSTNPFIDAYGNHRSNQDLLTRNCFNGSDFISVVIQQTNPFLKDTETKSYLFRSKNEELPDIDNSLFEVEEPELVHIFEMKSLLKNPFPESCLKNPFSDEFTSNLLKNTNPFEVPLKDGTSFCTSLSEEASRNTKLDSSEWHQHDKLLRKVLNSKLVLKRSW